MGFSQPYPPRFSPVTEKIHVIKEREKRIPSKEKNENKIKRRNARLVTLTVSGDEEYDPLTRSPFRGKQQPLLHLSHMPDALCLLFSSR
jgi:hypothetical protein